MQLFVDEEEGGGGPSRNRTGITWAMLVTHSIRVGPMQLFPYPLSLSLFFVLSQVHPAGQDEPATRSRNRSNATSLVGPRVIRRAPRKEEEEEGEKLASLCRNHRARKECN